MSGSGDTTAIVGAGVIGLAIACRLAHDGRDVLLIDEDDPGHGCSFGNAGHLATEQVMPLASPTTLLNAPRYLCTRDSPLRIRPAYALQILPWLARFAWAARPAGFRRGTEALSGLQAAAIPAFRRLIELAAIEDMLRTDGNLLLAETAAGRKALLADQQPLADCGVRSQWLEPGEVAEIAGGLPPTLAGALHFPDTGHVTDPYGICRGLLDDVLARGGRLLRKRINRIRAGTSGGFELTGDAGTLRCRRVVIAAGAWSAPLAAELGHHLPLDTERGYHLEAGGWHGDFSIPIASWERKTIMTPLAGGLRITGFVEFGGLELAPEDAHFERLRGHLEALLPEAEFPPLERWMGFRPSLPDHLPVIGRSHLDPDAFLAFGHQHLGLTLAGITAEIVADLVGGREPSVDIDAFRSDRFLGGG